MDNRKPNRILAIFGAIFLLWVGYLSTYTVDAGHKAVVKRFGQAVRDAGAGFHLKFPFIESIVVFDTRQLKHKMALTVGTKDSLRLNVSVSFNWQPDPSKVLEIINLYGSPRHLISINILPRVIQSSKEVFGLYSANELSENRDQVALAMEEALKSQLDDLPVIITRSYLENFEFPELYRRKINEKEEAKQTVQRKREELKKHEIQTQQLIQKAEVRAKSIKLDADANFYELTQKAKGLALLGKSIKNNPTILEQLLNNQWKGVLPRIAGSAGTDVNLLVNSERRGG